MAHPGKRHAQFIAPDAFAGHTLFVTGGGSGINLGIALAFAAKGARVAICGRSQERLDHAVQLLKAEGGDAIGCQADVRDARQLADAFARTSDELGDIDTLICGAAGNFLAPAEQLSPNGFRTVVDIDLLGSFNAAQGAFAQLQRTRGNIIFVSGPMATMPHSAQSHVCAAKAGVEMLMKTLALEWGQHGVRSNSIVPGLVHDTEGLRRIFGAASEHDMAAHVPLGRLGSVAEIGDVALFLASPLAAYVTGCTLWADGGQGLPGSTFFNRIAGDFLAANPPRNQAR